MRLRLSPARRRVTLGTAAFAAAAFLFFIANRGAYQGYFNGDEIDNLTWPRHVPASYYAYGFVAPKYFEHNFRPAGHLFFALMARAAKLDYRWYVLAIHALHLLNVWLVWTLLRRLGFAWLASGAGALFFAFHMGVFDAYWKPMYAFDVLCAAFALLAVLAYGPRSRWWYAGALVFFWLAFKSKEMAVMLPAALAVYEYTLGQRKWKRLAPFFAVSLVFGMQALLFNPSRGGDAYTLSLAPAEVWRAAGFYASRVFLLPYAGFAALAIPLVARDRRAWFGLAFFALLLFPMLLLTQRLFAAYLYLPLAGLAVALAALAGRLPPAAVAAFFLLWIPWNYSQLRTQRRAALSYADENRRYIAGVRDAAARNPEARVFVYDGVPAELHTWGIEAALRCFYDRQEVKAYPIEEVDLAAKLSTNEGVLLLSWDPAWRRLEAFARPPGAAVASFIEMNRGTPVWQLGEGWLGLTGQFRWTRPRATAKLRRPTGAREFELTVNMGAPPVWDPIRAVVLLDGRPIGGRALRRGSGFQTVRLAVPEGPPGLVEVEFRAEPPFTSDGPLGLAIAAFGFVP